MVFVKQKKLLLLVLLLAAGSTAGRPLPHRLPDSKRPKSAPTSVLALSLSVSSGPHGWDFPVKMRHRRKKRGRERDSEPEEQGPASDELLRWWRESRGVGLRLKRQNRNYY